MEASTAGAVEGANLAENAGEVLREIENVSGYNVDRRRRVAEWAQQQSKAAVKINATASAVQEITTRDVAGSRAAAPPTRSICSQIDP